MSENQRHHELNDLRWVLDDPRGRRVLWRLMAHCHVYESLWRSDADGGDRVMLRDTGRRDVGLFIFAEVMEARESAYAQMMREAKKEEIDHD
jgi:hypothetical protein